MFQSNGQRFPKLYLMTTGVEFCVKGVPVPETENTVELQIFDTAGQDVYAEMMPSFWEGALGVVLVYDVTRPHTFEAVGVWYDRLREALGKESLPGVGRLRRPTTPLPPDTPTQPPSSTPRAPPSPR